MRNLVIVLSLLVVLSSGCEMFGKKKRAEQAAIELQAKKDSTAKANKDAKDAKLKKQKEAKAKQEANRKAEEERKKLYKFHIIVGSFKTPKYASAYNELIATKGYQTEMMSNNYNFQMVSIGGFKSWREAVVELKKTREAIEPSSWIYIREN
jgi:cell division protein FtsN